eukprot:7078790-Lingulodinium_polyedra.AAC.1
MRRPAKDAKWRQRRPGAVEFGGLNVSNCMLASNERLLMLLCRAYSRRTIMRPRPASWLNLLPCCPDGSVCSMACPGTVARLAACWNT